MYKTKIGLFGCIKHSKYDFIGASPDGINILPGKMYGKMLEIKNIYNRNITGIPMNEYWVQMQVQMEVCDLNECDFLETRFCLYKSVEEFILNSNDSKFRGALLEFNNRFTFYYLWDYNNDNNLFISMIDNEILTNKYVNNEDGIIHWWYLDELSCVLVKRNKDWFNAILPTLKNTWNEIIKVRNKNINIVRTNIDFTNIIVTKVNELPNY
jgi:hypothetical protein